MDLEQAIKTAIEYEEKVRDAYLSAVDQIGDGVGKKVFEVLGKEEQGHVDFLQARLAEWKDSGQVTAHELVTVVPSRERIEAGLKRVAAPLATGDRQGELDLLKRALGAERETSAFYRRMVEELPSGQRELFRPFIEIEEGHDAIVQAEIDSIQGHGHWFDFMEFDLEAG